jgi:hypothetical protein
MVGRASGEIIPRLEASSSRSIGVNVRSSLVRRDGHGMRGTMLTIRRGVIRPVRARTFELVVADIAGTFFPELVRVRDGDITGED